MFSSGCCGRPRVLKRHSTPTGLKFYLERN